MTAGTVRWCWRSAAYNAGPGNVRKWVAANGDPRDGSVDAVDWIEQIPFGETRNYVRAGAGEYGGLSRTGWRAGIMPLHDPGGSLCAGSAASHAGAERAGATAARAKTN